MAVVIWFTYLETSGLTLEQIDQRFNGVPRDQLNDLIDTYDGGKPINESELRNVSRAEASAVTVPEKA
jgi:hypothetical protein